jgi:NAD(P)-dependent dehydrogenase (short-subunit alcohol dehydrogenase family)
MIDGSGDRLHGRVAIVTGGAGILGSAATRALAGAGARVAVVDVDMGRAEALAHEVAEALDAEIRAFSCDVSDPRSVASTVATVKAEMGGIDVLLNNAAAKLKDMQAFLAPFEEYELDAWREVMSVNLDGMFLVAQAVGKVMIEQGRGGAIVQTSSIYGVVAPDNRIYQGSELDGLPINSPAVYAASKAGVIGLTRYLAAYWAPHSIRVNTISPGGIFSGQNDEFVARYSARVPMGRMALADEVAAAALYLASDASSYVTGQNLTVDGGLTAW